MRPSRLFDASCGINNEYPASNALKAFLYRSKSHATKVLEVLRNLETDVTYYEWMKGRVGVLYILCLMRRWLPDLVVEINPAITSLIEAILPQKPWGWNGKQYLGTVHGEIGIVT